jgi:tetratricopeptide (TPR) repeat protein
LAIDPSLDWDDQKLLKEAGEVLKKDNFSGKSLYISLSGQLHMQNPEVTIDNVMMDTSDYTLFSRSNIAFSNMVKANPQNDLAFNWDFFPQDLHGTVPVPSIRNGLIAMFEWFQMEKTDRFNSFDTPKEELFDIVKYREKKLKDHFGYTVAPYEEDLFNMLGYMNMDMQQIEKSKMFFEFAIEYNPESANAYDSMADYYEKQNNLDEAIINVKQAFELSDSEYHKKRIESLKLKMKK